MAITLPTRMPDGTLRDVEYLTTDEVVAILPVSPVTVRRHLASKRWHGARFGGRWYMSRDDVADAVADARGEGTYALPVVDDQPVGPLGVVADDDGLDDLGGVR